MVSMTSKNTPAPYVVDASSFFDDGFGEGSTRAPWHGFDNNINFSWMTAFGFPINQWLSFDWGTGNEKLLRVYSVQASNAFSVSQCPFEWEIQGSNNFVAWHTLDFVTNQSGWSHGQVRNFTCDTQTTFYRFFRIFIFLNNGDTDVTSVNQLSLGPGLGAKVY